MVQDIPLHVYIHTLEILKYSYINVIKFWCFFVKIADSIVYGLEYCPLQWETPIQPRLDSILEK